MKGLLFILLCCIALPCAQESATDSVLMQPTPSSLITDGASSQSGELTPKPMVADTAKKLNRIPVVKRNLKYRAQIGAALGMMAFLTVILGSTQNWNP